MTCQDGGTDGYWPPGKRLHRGWPRPAVARSLALVGALFFLTACEGIMGGLLTSGVTYLGDSVGNDMRTTAAWRAKHQEIVSQVLNNIMAQCRNLEGPGTARTQMALNCYRKALDFSEEQQPRILVERLADRARRAKERRADVAPVAKMVQPTERLSFPSGFPEVLRGG